MAQVKQEKIKEKEEIKVQKIYQFDLDHTFIKEYSSITDAAYSTKFNREFITNVCQNKQKSACGFLWSYTKKLNLKVPDGKDIPDFTCFRVTPDGKVFSKVKMDYITSVVRSNKSFVRLRNANIEKGFYICNLVADAFLNNTDATKTVIKNINNNILDNRVENLIFITKEEHKLLVQKDKPKIIKEKVVKIKKVYKYNLENVFMKEYASLEEASKKTKIDITEITQACNNVKHKEAGGFNWSYLNILFIEKPNGKVLPKYPNYVILKNSQIYSNATKQYLEPRVRSGFHTVRLYRDGIRDEVNVHDIIADAYILNKDKSKIEYTLVHISDNKLDNRVENLKWVPKVETVVKPRKEKYQYKPRVKIAFEEVEEDVEEDEDEEEEEEEVEEEEEDVEEDEDEEEEVEEEVEEVEEEVVEVEVVIEDEEDKKPKKNNKINTRERQVDQYTADGKFIKTFSSVREASTQLNIPERNIYKCCSPDTQRHTTRGFAWKYHTETVRDNLQDNNQTKDILNFPNYEITDDGRVISKRYKKYVKPSLNADGYLHLTLTNINKIQKFFVHDLVAAAYLENLNNKKIVNHKDSNKTNNNIANLEWRTK
jgi:hypothetical protein